MALASRTTEPRACGLREAAFSVFFSRDLGGSSLTVRCYVLIEQRQEGQWGGREKPGGGLLALNTAEGIIIQEMQALG